VKINSLVLDYTAQSHTIKHQTIGFKSLVETPIEWIGSTITLNRLIGRTIYDISNPCRYLVLISANMFTVIQQKKEPIESK
jgi:hypothetical protein